MPMLKFGSELKTAAAAFGSSTAAAMSAAMRQPTGPLIHLRIKSLSGATGSDSERHSASDQSMSQS